MNTLNTDYMQDNIDELAQRIDAQEVEIRFMRRRAADQEKEAGLVRGLVFAAYVSAVIVFAIYVFAKLGDWAFL